MALPAGYHSSLAAEIASVDKVDFNCAQSASKTLAGEQFRPELHTMALMHGGIAPRYYFGWSGAKGIPE